MKTRSNPSVFYSRGLLLFIFFINLLTIEVFAQSVPGKGLFESDEVIPITLSGNIKDVLKDRASDSKKHSASLSFTGPDSTLIYIPVQLQTRGNFRRLKENCNYPPLWIHFGKTDSTADYVFKDQKKTKLVMPCLDDDYVIREWLVYKLHNLVTPLSFRARLVKVQFEDPALRRTPAAFYAFLLEEEKQMAKRNNMLAVEQKIRPEQTQTADFLMTSVFEYLVGNTDWSVQYLHNIKLLTTENVSAPITVAYDFDHAGIVSAPYAKPAEELRLSSVRERRYRGYCINDMKLFEPAISRFNLLKSDIYGLYNDCKLLDAKYLKFVNRFLDEFYETINNPAALQKAFSYPCDVNGTGNIVIKGLKGN